MYRVVIRQSEPESVSPTILGTDGRLGVYQRTIATGTAAFRQELVAHAHTVVMEGAGRPACQPVLNSPLDCERLVTCLDATVTTADRATGRKQDPGRGR